ncbi:peptidase inhibitor family I36 protein, partial [Yersinia aleksiciae]|uniref:peptidase inhibitor family I36 protein n=1 Tax=Yersinia aleksiciae TaxID=263819 RepID=UPI001643A8FF
MSNNNIILLFSSMLAILSSDVLADKPKVCFYADSYYEGAFFCAAEGTQVSTLISRWNDTISSISIPHGMSISVYQDEGYSGHSLTLRNSVDFLSTTGLENYNDMISSFKINDAVCFYEYSDFRGESICLADNSAADLYDKTLDNISDSLNDRVSSISIPPDMQATVYQDDNYNGDRLVLTESYSLDGLKEISMAYNVTSIKASQISNFICDQFCAIQRKMTIPIRKTFGDYWTDNRIGSK